MPTKSKLRTTTSKGSAVPHGRSWRTVVARRLPINRAPTHPGEMLLEEFLRPFGISQSEFATRLGVSFPRLNEISHGKRGVTPDTALRLARVLGMSADFWLGLQQDWDLRCRFKVRHGDQVSSLTSCNQTQHKPSFGRR